MKVGDVIRVQDWPGTHGKRFKIVGLDATNVEALDPKKGARRVFPRSNCHVDRKRTKAGRS